MRKFNRIITVSITLDAIAQQLLNCMKDDITNREEIAYNITGHMEAKGRIGQLYAIVNNLPQELPFNIGQIVYVRVGTYVNKNANNDNNDLPVWEHQRITLSAEVVEIHPFDDSPLKLKYAYTNSKGEVTEQTDRFAVEAVSTEP